MSHVLDLSDLSPDAVRAVESLVNSFRSKGEIPSPNRVDPEAWADELRRWSEAQAKRDIVIDDDRDNIYADCGE